MGHSMTDTCFDMLRERQQKKQPLLVKSNHHDYFCKQKNQADGKVH